MGAKSLVSYFHVLPARLIVMLLDVGASIPVTPSLVAQSACIFTCSSYKATKYINPKIKRMIYGLFGLSKLQLLYL